MRLLGLLNGKRFIMFAKTERGLTLVEVLLAMGISVVVGGLLLAVIVNNAGIFYKQSSKVTEVLNINDALSQIKESIREANAIVSSYNGGGNIYTSGATQIVFQLPSIDSSNNIIANTFDYFVYFADGSILRFKSFPDPTSSRHPQNQIFATNLNNVTFQYFDSANPPNSVTPSSATRIRVSLTLRQKSGAAYETTMATSEASLRND